LCDGIDSDGENTSLSCVPDALVLFSPVIDTSTEGYGNAKVGARWKELSPADLVRPGLPPTIVFHGTGDTTTPFTGAKKFQEAMLRAGNKSELVSVEGAPHTYMFKDATLHAETIRKLDSFLASNGFTQKPAEPRTP
jgi:acetyl esterase/lipase